jgi:hypothetical protein
VRVRFLLASRLMSPARPGRCQPFRAVFPASSPYVTTVGATQLSPSVTGKNEVPWGGRAGRRKIRENVTVRCAAPARASVLGGDRLHYHVRRRLQQHLCTAGACVLRLLHGVRRLAQAYQAAVVDEYLANATGLVPPQGYFNASGRLGRCALFPCARRCVLGRAYPDVTLLGNDYLMVRSSVKRCAGGLWLTGRWAGYLRRSVCCSWNIGVDARRSGSCAPARRAHSQMATLQALFSLLNDLRLQSGQAPFGFLNPW